MSTKVSTKNSADKETLLKIDQQLQKYYNISIADATDKQIFNALAHIAIDKAFEKRRKFSKSCKKSDAKAVNYLCMEFLIGKTLRTSLFNLGLDKTVEKVLKAKGKNIENVYKLEDDAGLGNGGLGRLASCFLDSLATLDYPVTGHCIRYDYGLFKQKFVDGKQTELPDEWLSSGDTWQIPRPDKACVVRFGGYINEYVENGHMKVEYNDCTEVEAFPYDMMFNGYDSKNVAVLRLWSAKSFNAFDTKKFSQGEYAQALAEKNEIELISKVLYPADDHMQGKSLRLRQQYFLASASMQSIVATHIRRYKDLKLLPKFIAVHINDTHPVLCVPELMRILMDDNELSWAEAWDIVTKTVSYTNHTVLKESLEVWDESLIARTVPRIYNIIKEIDRRFRNEAHLKGLPGHTIENMAVISNRRVRMTNLAVISAHKINGVSKLHSNILKDDLLGDFSAYYPNKFTNVTNGVTHRRWLCESNPRLSNLIESLIGKKFIKNANELEKLGKYLDDKKVIKEVEKIKFKNKEDFAKFIYETQGVKIDPKSRFDVQAKRIHEYKRQLLNVLYIIYLYSVLKANPEADITPQTFIFAGKAASGYRRAKEIVYLINQLAEEVNNNEKVNKKLKIVFVENYSVSIAEKLMPATDVSEQISLAGQEASGTGNMKAVYNGGLMICTADGANIEITDVCGENSSFMFGMKADEVENVWKTHYEPATYYSKNPKIKTVIDMLNKGFNGVSFSDLAKYLLSTADVGDPYMCLADFDSYVEAHEKLDKLYRKPALWHKQCLKNISKMGYFSSDRSIEDYAKDIWDLKKTK
ncbi:MAG: glycogen/starch/alpha-glucan phosphorylase [Clostridia bacterium]|nr:glycogen/starch/alpha-glucan phosphorylase [Clostridia bacterium]